MFPSFILICHKDNMIFICMTSIKSQRLLYRLHKYPALHIVIGLYPNSTHDICTNRCLYSRSSKITRNISDLLLDIDIMYNNTCLWCNFIPIYPQITPIPSERNEDKLLLFFICLFNQWVRLHVTFFIVFFVFIQQWNKTMYI